MFNLPKSGPTLDRLVRITIGDDLAVSTGQAGTAPPPPVIVGLDAMSAKAKRGYSLRKLYSSYQGPCVNVQLETGGAQVDIGFVDNKLDVATLLAFSGPDQTNVRVVKWYDQSGNGKDAVSTAFVTGFPAIAGLGGVIYRNGWPQIDINRASSVFDNSDAAQFNFTLSIVFSTTDTGDGTRWFQMSGLLYADSGGPVNDFGFGVFNEELTLGMGPNDAGVFPQSPVPVLDGLLHVGWATQDSGIGVGQIFVDSVSPSGQHSTPTVARSDSLTCAIGSYNGTHIAEFLTCEAIVFDSVIDDSDKAILLSWQSQYTAGQ